MIRKKAFGFLLLSVLLVCSPSLFSQEGDALEGRVAVLPLWFDSNLSVGETLSLTVQKNIMLILRLYPEYALIDTEEYPEQFPEVPAYAEARDLDTVIFGRVSQEDGRYTVSLQLYGREFNKIMSTRQDSVRSYMDMFDLSDRLSMLILEDYQKRALDFGALSFTSQPGDMENYRVFIDGKPVGESVRSIPFIEAGVYSLRVEEFYDDGRTRDILDKTVKIEPEKETKITVRPYPYTEVTVLDEGAGLPFTVNLGDIRADGEVTAEIQAPAGQYPLTITQLDYKGEPYLLKETSLDVELGTAYAVAVETQNLGRGMEFLPQRSDSEKDETEFEGEILMGEEPIEGLSVEVLPLGTYPVRIYQRLEGERLLVYDKELTVSEEKMRTIQFPLFPTRKAWAHFQKNGKPALSVVVQALDGSYGQMGLRFEGLMRRVGLSLLGGAHWYDGALCPTAKAKIQWMPWGGGSLFSPELGVLGRMDYSKERLFLSTGPQVGLTWNTGLPVLTSVFVENELRWNLEGPFHLFYYVSIGARLF